MDIIILILAIAITLFAIGIAMHHVTRCQQKEQTLETNYRQKEIDLHAEYDQKVLELQEGIYQRKIALENEFKQKRAASYENYLKKEDERKRLQESILNDVPYFYNIKASAMNTYEQRAFYFFQKIIETDYRYEKYCIFPQHQLSSCIELTKQVDNLRNKDKAQFDPILRNITSKSLDFLFCKISHEKRTYTSEYGKPINDTVAIYKPCLVVEIDGDFHRRGDPDVERNDNFKNKLFAQLNVPFARLSAEKRGDITRKNCEILLHNYLG